MVGPLLLSKLRTPRGRPAAVPRPRLVERLTWTAQTRLTVISAPAGFGKTTLLTQWLAELAAAPFSQAFPVAWVSLDKRDSEPTTFWTYVISALQSVAGDPVGLEALSLLGTQQGPEPALIALLNELQGLPQAIVLVLDDYHVVESQEVHDGLGYLLENLPPQVHLVLATRVDPPLALPRLRARGELIEVRSADLRFTVDETAAYLGGSMALTLAATDIAILAERTEGWAAALQLAGLTLQGRDDPGAVIAQFAGDDRFIVDYLTDEVLTRQSDAVREFLLTTSILDRLTGPLCDAVSALPGGTARLMELERANLFLIALDDRRQWFRYHHLFADVLRAHLNEGQPERVTHLHLKAAEWFQANGEPAEAVRHALLAKDFSRAADFMELAIPMVARERREAEFSRWVRALPDGLLEKRPVLAVAYVGSLAQASQFDTVDARLTAIERSLRAAGAGWPERPPLDLVVVDDAGFRAVPATIELYRAALALSASDLAGTALHACEALRLAPAEGGLVRAAAGALGGLASWTIGDLVGAHAAYTESIRGLESLGYVADVLGCTITLGDVECTTGKLGQALRTYRHALDLATPALPGMPLRGAADMHVGMARVLLERGNVTAAAEHLAASAALGERSGLPQHPYRSRVVAAHLRQVEGDFDAALELLDEADRVYNGDYSPNVAPVPAMRARLRIRRDELRHAADWADERRLSADDELSYLTEYEHITLARLLLAQHRASAKATLDDAMGLLERLLAAAQAGGRTGTVIEILVLLALVQQANANVPSALTAVERAMALGEGEGYVRLFADEGAPMTALLKAVANPALASYSRQLVAAASPPLSTDVPSQRALIEPLSARELDVLRLLATDLAGPEIARQLHISLNTMRTHSRSIFGKLQVNNRRAAVRQANELDLLTNR